MSYFPYPTPPLRSGVICLRGEEMSTREEMTPEEIEEYLSSTEDEDSRGDRPEGDYEDGDGGEQVKA